MPRCIPPLEGFMYGYKRASLSEGDPDPPEGMLELSLRKSHKIRLITCYVALALLIAAHITLISLWATHALDEHLFSVTKVNVATQAITIVAQAWITMLLTLLGYVVQGIMADQIIRRRQTVAALQDSLDSWKGLGSSLVSLWRGRRSGSRLRLSVLIAMAFFAAASVLQISTPSVVTVSTANATESTQLNVTTMPGNIVHLNLSVLTWGEDISMKNIIDSMPYAWNQSAAGIGTPAGLNGSVFFSTLEAPQNESLTFHDPYARDLKVACASIPPSTGDFYEIEWYESGGVAGQLFLIFQKAITPTDGVQVLFSGAQPGQGQYQLGGEKPSRDSPPTFTFPPRFYVLTAASSPPYHTDFATTAFAVISAQNDAIGANLTRGILPPIVVPFQATVRSWVHDPNSTPGEEKKHAFLENGTFTLYIWPIGCSLYIDNITAEVRGNNKLLSSTSKNTDVNRADLFKREQPTDPLLINWEPLIQSLWFSETGSVDSTNSSGGDQIPAQWLENILYAPLNSSVPSGIGFPPTVAERMAAMEKKLEQLTALTYGMIVQSFRSQARDDSTAVGSDWKPTSAIVAGQRVVLRGKFVVNGLQVVVSTICVCVLAFSVLFSVAQRGNEAPGSVAREGGVIDLISLVNHSALPRIIAGANAATSRKDERRAVAEQTMIVLGSERLDAAERIGDEEPLQRYTSQSAVPEPDADPLSLTSRVLDRLPYYTVAPRPDFRPWHTTLKPHYLITQIILASFLASNVAFVLLWATRFFDRHLWPIAELAKISQITSTLAQLWSVGPLLVLAHVIQAIASDKSIRRQQTVAELHDSLGAWGGLGASIGAVWREARHARRVTFDVMMVTSFFSAIMLLHITMPTVLSVESITRQVPINSTAFRTPGQIVDIGYDADSGYLTPDLRQTLSTLPYLYGQRNVTSTHLPAGISDLTLFSAINETFGNEEEFDDPYASQLGVHCGIVPRSPSIDQFAVGWTMSGWVNESNLEVLTISAEYGYQLSGSLMWSGAASARRYTAQGDFTFGGPKSSANAPPTIKMTDFLMWGDLRPNGSLIFDYATVPIVFVSLRNDTLRLNSVAGSTPVVKTENITSWVWVTDPSLTWNQQIANAYPETMDVTFYIYPLACSLYATPPTARVRGDGVLFETNTTTDLRTDLNGTPFIRSHPVHNIELMWVNLTRGIYNLESSNVAIEGNHTIEFTWMEYTLLDCIINGTGIRALEDSLSYISSLSYALLAQSWRSKLFQDAQNLSQSWIPQDVTLNGTQSLVYARLKIGDAQLIITFASTIILIIVSFVSTYGHADDHIEPIIRDGGVIDLLSLVADSALPGVIEEGAGDSASGRDGRRVRAEETPVAYSIGSLDLPERLQRRANEAIIQGGVSEEGRSAC